MRPRHPFAQQQQQPMTPEEEQSLLRSIGSKTLGGIATAAAPLDYVGGGIRNALVGQAPALNPFSYQGRATGRDVLEKWGMAPRNVEGFHPIDNPEDAFFDAAGFATEVATDPLTYATFGMSALGKGGQALKGAGLLNFAPDVFSKLKVGPRVGRMNVTTRQFVKNLPDDVRKVASGRMKDVAREAGLSGKQYAKMMKEPVGGLMGLGPPFMRPATTIGQAGTWAEPIAKGMDWLGHGIRYSLPVRAAAAGFSKPLQGAMGPAGQKAAAAASRLEEFSVAQMREKLGGHFGQLKEMGALTEDLAGVENGRVMRQYLEGTLPRAGKDPYAAGRFAEDTQLRSILDDMHNITEEYLKREQAMGLSTGKLSDFIQYFPRQLTHFGESITPGGGVKGLSARHKFQQGRKEFLKDLSLGSEVVNRMSLDARISGTMARGKLSPAMSKAAEKHFREQLAEEGLSGSEIQSALESAFPVSASGKGRATALKAEMAGESQTLGLKKSVEYIEKKYGKDLMDEWGDLSKEKVTQLARWLANLDPQHVATKIPAFGHNPLVDLVRRVEHGEHAMAAAEAVYSLIGKSAKHFDDVPMGEEWVRVGAAQGEELGLLAQANLTGPGAPAKAARSLPDDVTKRFGNLPAEALSDGEAILANVWVPKDIAADVVRMNKAFTAPDFMRPFLDAYQSYTNWFRAHVTSYWPAFISRNQVSGQLQNWIGGAYGSGVGKAGMRQSLTAAAKLIGDAETISDVLEIPFIKRAGITNAKQATQKIRELAFAHKLGGKMQTEFAHQVGGSSYASLGDTIAEMPGLHPFSLKETLKTLDPRKPGALKPWATRGVGGRTESQFALSKWGEAMGYGVESLNRIAPFISMLRRGIDPGVAARRIKLLQVDYMAGAAGDAIARNVFPFWSFVKGQAQYLAKELTTRPGGGLAQAIRAESLMSREGLPPLLPEHVRTSAAIPLPPGPTGATRVLGSLGMMHEDPLQALAMDSSKPFSSLGRNFLREAVGRTNPLIQKGIEEATGVSTFQAGPRGGRSLVDMDPAIGRLLGNIVGSEDPVPVSRGLELAGSLTAPRAISSAKTGTDYRKEPWAKVLNLTTGLRVTDVPPRTQDALLREGVSERMQDIGARSFERVYFPKRMLAKMPPEKRQAAIETQTLMNTLAKRARDRAKLAAEEF